MHKPALSFGIFQWVCLCSALAVAQEPNNYLSAARKVANWLDAVAIADGDVIRWPTVPDESPQSSNDLYSGNAGVVLFYLRMHRVTSDEAYLRQAALGADGLLRAFRALSEGADTTPDTVAGSQRLSSGTARPEPGLFSGLAGMAYVLRQVGEASREQRFIRGNEAVVDYLRKAAQRGEYAGHNTLRWNTVNDIIGGSAGIGFFFLEEFAATRNEQFLQDAVAIGDGLLAVARPAEARRNQELKWLMDPEFPREMPNYSHGTAGVCDFLVRLHLACQSSDSMREKAGHRFLDAARRGAEYLGDLASRSPKQLIPHHFPDGESLFYLGWCHGPAGSIRLFQSLASADQPDARTIEVLIRGLRQAGLPDRSEGYWNNVGVCCGNSGLASFLLTLGQAAEHRRLAKVLIDDALARATLVELPDGRKGLKWLHAEHRVRPEFVQAQTGLMQGAAGIGLVLLQFHETLAGQPATPPVPTLPF